jgi:hypothetical protein
MLYYRSQISLSNSNNILTVLTAEFMQTTELYTEITCVIYAILPSGSSSEHTCFINLLVPALNLKEIKLYRLIN